MKRTDIFPLEEERGNKLCWVYLRISLPGPKKAQRQKEKKGKEEKKNKGVVQGGFIVRLWCNKFYLGKEMKGFFFFFE